jgi:toxin FitB
MIVLDTNVLSALMQVAPDETVSHWLDRQPRDSIWITSVTVMEIRFGLQAMSPGRKQAALKNALVILLEEKIQERIVPFDIDAAERAAELMAARKLLGRPIEYRDTMIAGIVMSRNATFATRNTAHFADLGSRVVNPWNS